MNQSRMPNHPNNDVPPTQESSMPQGRPYEPSNEDLRPLHKDPQHEVPRFIPRELPEDPTRLMHGSNNPLPPMSEGYVPAEDDVEADEMIRAFHAQESKPTQKQAPTSNRNDTTTLPEAPKRHPMLDRLLSSFGLEKLPIKSTDIGNMKLSFRRLSTADHMISIRYAHFRSNNPVEMKTNLKYIQAALAITAVNDVSIYDMLEYEMSPSDKVAYARDPGNPPNLVVEATALPIITTIVDGLLPEVLDSIVVAYNELFEEDKVVASDIDTYRRTHWRFECVESKCEEVQNRVPRIINVKSGAIHNVYCPVHGTPMRAVSSLEDYRNGPLA